MTEQEAIEAELIQRELASREQSNSQPSQNGFNIGQFINKLSQPNIAGPLGNVLPIEEGIGGIVGGALQPPIQLIGQTGQAISQQFGGATTPYSVPMPKVMGGDIPINPPQTVSQAIEPGVFTALQMLGFGGGVKKATDVAGKVAKYDGALVQAKKAKESLDTLRDTIGQAKNIALQEVKDIPVDLNFSGNVSQKVINAIKDPIYNVEFTPEGGVLGTIGNLDKVKSALRDLVTKKDFVEAGNMEKRQIMQFSGRVRDDMVNAANKAGKPQLGKALADYHKFMDNYELINDHLVDKYGNAMANKLKTTFKIFSEPAIKEAWKEVSKSSPEVKQVMKSMEHRELMKNLLKVSGAATALGVGGKTTIDLISGK